MAHGVRGFLRVAFRVVLILAAILVLAAGLIVLRLENGPLSIAALSPLIEELLSASDGSFRVTVAEAELALDDDGHSLVIAARGAQVENRRDEVLARIPALSLGLSLEALLHLQLAPTRIVVTAPELRLERDVTGAFQLGVGGSAAPSGELTRELVADFLAPPASGGPASYLEEISLHNATLTVEDHALGASWRAPRVAATLFRGNAGMSGDLALAIEVAGKAAELHGDFRYLLADHRLSVDLALADWDMAKLRNVLPILAPLAGIQAPIGGTIQATLDPQGQRLDGVRIDLSAAAGTLADPAFPGGALAIAGGRLTASYGGAEQRLTLQRLSIDLGGPMLSVAGSAEGLDLARVLGGGGWGDGLAIAAEASARGVPADDLGRIWPIQLARNARDWITQNIHDGTVEEARLATRFRFDPWTNDIAGLDAFAGTLRMRGLTIDYHHPLPPVRGVDGTATFDDKRMTLLPTSGTLKGSHITGGKIVITDLDVVDQWIDIALDVDGPLRDPLEVIDTKPLEYAHQVGLDPARVEGTADTRLAFYFMLDHRTTWDQVKLGVDAKLAGVALRKVALGQDLTEGNLQLHLDRNAVTLDGTGRLAGVPATVGWLQNFKPRDGVTSRYTARGSLDDAARKRLGLDSPKLRLTGPIDIDARVTNFADKHGEGRLAVDLKTAAVAVPDLDWSKSSGVPAAAKIDLALAGDQISAIPVATLKGGGADLELAAAFARGELQRIEAKRLVLGESDLAGTVARREEGGWRAELRGAAFDATGLVGNLGKPGPTSHDEAPLVIDGKFDRVILGPKREATAVVLQLFSDGVHWQTVNLDARPFGQGSLRLRFGQSGNQRTFTFATSDFGAALRLLDITDHVAGGSLSATGRAEDSGVTRTFIGHLDGGNYRLVNAPIIAKLLSLASFTSIGSLLSGEGIPFSRITGDFMATDGKIALRQMRAYGGALGVNASGTLDLDKGVLDLDGTLVPAYMLNSILGNIPLIGDLLQGGEGQGIFAAGFHAGGPIDDPKFTVNPLSALAPGFLRNLFLFDPGDQPTPAPPPPKEVK